MTECLERVARAYPLATRLRSTRLRRKRQDRGGALDQPCARRLFSRLRTGGSMRQARPAPVRSGRMLLYGCFVASGAAGLILELVWSKYLSLLLGNSIYGVSTVVAAFLGGLGLGAFVGGRLAERTREPLLVYARLELAIGALGLI